MKTDEECLPFEAELIVELMPSIVNDQLDKKQENMKHRLYDTPPEFP